MATTSPTARTLAWLREQNCVPWVVEKWNPFARIRQDLYGCIDIVFLKGGVQGLTGIQATTDSHRAERIEKIKGIDAAALWLRCGNGLWVVTWGKHRAGRRVVWTPHTTVLKWTRESGIVAV